MNPVESTRSVKCIVVLRILRRPICAGDYWSGSGEGSRITTAVFPVRRAA